jgi:peptide deformylase
MANRNILQYSENPKVLRQINRSVERVDKNAQRLIEHLKDTQNAHKEGIGIATPSDQYAPTCGHRPLRGQR